MSFYLALDGGGTKTQCWIADEARVLGRAATGSVKLMQVGATDATARLQALVDDTAREAGVALSDIQQTCFGLAGSSSATVRVWAERVLRERVGGGIEICGDEEIALDAAFQAAPGILVIAGTGSNVVGRCADGTRHAAGGWGPVIGDEGSGHWIGVEAVKVALRADDRGVTSCLQAEIQKHWSLRSRAELIAHANAQPRSDFASLTTVVAACAGDGDALAQGVLDRAGLELAAQVSLVASKMRTAGCASADARRVAFTGSVLAKMQRVRDAMVSALPEVVVLPEAVEPLEGALWRARHLVR